MILTKSLNFNVCVCTFIGGAKGGGGVGGLIHRAVVVIELFSLSNLNFKVLKQSKYTWATIVATSKSHVYRKEANSRDRKSNIEKGQGLVIYICTTMTWQYYILYNALLVLMKQISSWIQNVH